MPGGVESIMSTAQIIEELPRLSAAELMAVRRKLMELAVEDEDVEMCNAAALDGAGLMDRMEEEDVGG